MRNMNIYAELAVENVEAYKSDAVEAVKALYDSMLCGSECFIIFNKDGVTFTRKEPEYAVILEEGFDYDPSMLTEYARRGMKEEDITGEIERVAEEIIDALSIF